MTDRTSKKRVDRWDFTGIDMEGDPSGEYVLYEDVKHLLQDETKATQALVTAPDMREILICAEGGLLTSDPETRALALETVQRALGGWPSPEKSTE